MALNNRSRLSTWLVVATVAAMLLNACGAAKDVEDPYAAVNGTLSLVCDTDHLFAEVQWIIDQGWNRPGAAILRSVSAMPLPEGYSGSALKSRLIGAYIESPAGDARFLWLLTFGQTDISTISIPSDDVLFAPLNMGYVAEADFPRFTANHSWPAGTFQQIATESMSECLGGEVNRRSD